ncbi:helix-turn-helix domain-containing protein [Tenacibaculum maritimum]|nr:AraC family transcriptional regulator [Tenacibaculum maritimum]MCD9561828.1 AraC family transcriptional regulator [Tenacibaculum maritimum]MCD9566714.1 AraC family transcriptional regulator [Tenacibaculum maritimum]MCD9578664.1 AraC family transcriptional regulator [Tenacibaculum maritimum]MCD9581056.1 AraC family transcriptional regulator [Tenacibaculum maritimum]MCD9585260.1 AraC family transcriptional regulator [Tenacibaculum maritimum]
MPIESFPEIYIQDFKQQHDLLIYDFKMTRNVIKSKVNLNMNMFSFLPAGRKQLHFANASISVDKKQSLLLKKGNWLWTELMDFDTTYFCKLFFFSEKKLIDFLNKYTNNASPSKEETPYFIIENDSYITSFLNSLSNITSLHSNLSASLLSIKFDEILLYLLNKYGTIFELYLHTLISREISSFKSIIEKNTYSNLKLEEIAFLCNMSLSTFKRRFISEYNEAPGKWLKNKRLQRAKKMLESGNLKPSDIYLEMGYNNLSNFSTAFKKKFGVSPKNIF